MSSIAAFIVAVLLLLSWNVAVAGRIAQQHTAPAAFRLASGVGGFLVVPGLLVFIGGESALSARALGGLAWLWPALTLLVTGQAAYALHRRFASPWLLAPLVGFDLLIATAAVVRYADSLGLAPPAAAFVPGLALADLIARAAGLATFASPMAVMVPVLAPGGSARSAAGAATRGALALGAAVAVALIAVASPAAHTALGAYSRFGTARATETPLPHRRSPLMVGLRVFPVLTRAPAAAVLRDDLALADSLGARALLVRIRPEACTAAALDSLDRALEGFRRDSAVLMVTLAYAPEAGLAARTPDSSYVAQRAADVERIVRRLRPEYLVPADLPFQDGRAALGDAGLAWWKHYFTVTALAAHRVRPATRVVLTSAAESGADSALFDWAATGASPIDATIFAILPHPGGARYVEATLATADRWMARPAMAREHWIVAAAAPALESAEVQRRLARHVLLWAAVRPQVRGVVLADASDYDRMTGFRTARGRIRPAVADAAATVRTLVEPLAPPP